MYYLYHRIPADMRGSILYPLNVLKNKHPEVYNEELRKYKGREHVLNQRIPTLNCYWNDVIFLTAVHPQKLYDLRRKIGFSQISSPIAFFEVNPLNLDIDKLSVFLFHKDEDWKNQLPPTEFTSFNMSDISKYSHIPDVTKEYFRELYNQGARERIPLFFRYTPHILYRGALETKNLKKITIV